VYRLAFKQTQRLRPKFYLPASTKFKQVIKCKYRPGTVLRVCKAFNNEIAPIIYENESRFYSSTVAMEFVVHIGRRNSYLLKVFYLRDFSQLDLQWHKSDRTISAMSARLADCCPALRTITIYSGPNRKKELWKLEFFQNIETLMECFPQLSCLSYKPKNFTHRSLMLTVPRMPNPAHMSPHPRHVSPDHSYCRENTNL
jgi:hypothetical protein